MKSLMLVTILLMTSCVAGQDTQNCADCHNKQCISIGDAAIHEVDNSVNPCVNFYQFACGGWLHSQIVNNERKRLWFSDTDGPLEATIKLLSQGFKDGDPDALKKAKNLFKSCRNSVHGYGNTIANFVRELFGTWPIDCERKCNLSPYNLERTLIKMTRLGAHPLFTLSAHVNHLDYNVTAKNARRYLHIGEPKLYMPRRDYIHLSNSQLLKFNYNDMITSSAANIVTIDTSVKYSSITDYRYTPPTKARITVEEIMKVEMEIARQIRESREGTIKLTLESLNQRYGKLMNWTRYINELASTGNLGEITMNETIFVEHPSALTSIINHFLWLSKKSQVNYFSWRLFDTLQNARIKPEDKLDLIYRAGDIEDNDAAYRDGPCAWFVTQSLPLVVQRLLYAEYLSPVTFQKVNWMIQQIKYEFNSLLATKNWLDENAKRFIKEKIDSITTVVANYVEVMDDEFLDSYYSSVAINSTHEYIEPDLSSQVAMLNEKAFIRNFRSILPAANFRVDLDVSPLVVSAQLVTQFHEIVLSFASIFRPWFMEQALMAVNYAGAIYTLAHALVKSVDSQGMLFHRNGTEGNWTDDANKVAIDDRVRCFIDQYSKYQSPSWIVNQTVGADFILADNVALKLAFKAYSNYSNTARIKRYTMGYSGYTNDQLFFIRSAQLLCNEGLEEPPERMYYHPTKPEFRINQPLQNSRDFAYAFDCQCGSAMNPDNKCEVW